MLRQAALTTCLLIPIAPRAAPALGDPERGGEAFGLCAACHAVMPGRHRTGPSLAQVFGHQAGTVPGFTRYSPALKDSGLTWDETTLDAWLADPAALVPGNSMVFRGIPDGAVRADIVAYLKGLAAGTPAGKAAAAASPDLPDLKGCWLRSACHRHPLFVATLTK